MGKSRFDFADKEKLIRERSCRGGGGGGGGGGGWGGRGGGCGFSEG